MGLLENQRRKRHELSLDWNELVMMMLLDHELDMAERAGVPEHVRTQSATRIRDAVVAKVGQPGIVRVFIDTDYEMRTPDKDAVVARALAASGYDDQPRPPRDPQVVKGILDGTIAKARPFKTTTTWQEIEVMLARDFTPLFLGKQSVDETIAPRSAAIARSSHPSCAPAGCRRWSWPRPRP